jgi:hypothetical protein
VCLPGNALDKYERVSLSSAGDFNWQAGIKRKIHCAAGVTIILGTNLEKANIPNSSSSPIAADY